MHNNCRRSARSKIERLSYLCYQLQLYIADGCEESGVPQCQPELEVVKRKVDLLRQRFQNFYAKQSDHAIGTKKRYERTAKEFYHD